MNRFRSLFPLVPPVAVLALAVACSKPAPVESPASTPSTPAPATSPAPVAPPATPASGAPTMAAPADFPKDVPILAGSSITGGTSGSSATGTGSTLELETTEKPEKVVEWYKAEMAKGGWATTIEVPAPGGKSAFFKKENRTVTVKASADPRDAARTAVTVIVSEDKTGASAAKK